MADKTVTAGTASLDPDDYGKTVSLRSNEQSQLTEMIPIVVEVFSDLDGEPDSAESAGGADDESESDMVTGAFEEKADTLAQLQAEIETSDDGTVTFTEDDWRVLISSLGYPEVKDVEGTTRVDYLRRKLARRALDDLDVVKAI